MHAIESKENFSQEIASLINKIQEQIDGYSDSVSNESPLNTKDTVAKINVLKKYDLLLKPFPTMLEDMDQSGWEEKKEELQKTFKEGQDALKGYIKN